MFRRLEGAPDEELATTRVVGEGGCLIVTDEAFEDGAVLELLISASQRVVKTRARVVYCIQQDEETWHTGVEFLHVAPEDAPILESLLKRSRF